MPTLREKVVEKIEDECVSSTIKLAYCIGRPLWWAIKSLVFGPATRLNVKEETRRLSTETLPAIKSIIDLVEGALLRKEMETRAASERAIQADERVIQESWLLTLKDLAYDIQDIVDEVSTETALHPLPNATRWRTLNFWVDLVCGCFAPSCLGYSDMHMLERCPLKFYVHVAYKINAVYSQLENMKAEKERLNILPSIIIRSQLPFVDSSGARANGDQTYEREHRLTTSRLDNYFKPVGRDEEKANIVGILMDTESMLLVIPIVGMGGLGKTTLAKVVFDDESIKQHFHFLKWVFVGTNFDFKLVWKKLLPDNQQSDDDLEERVVKEIKDKTFLIVLDDVWEDDWKKWKDFKKPLTYGKAGRIIITTRSKEVANVACSNQSLTPLSLTVLSHDYCVELFEKHAFPGGCLDKHSHLREIGKQIVDRLGGLPLALEVVGSALRADTNESSWMSILNENICVDESISRYDIMPALVWSYHRLPYHLKQCFRYCSLFSREDASLSKTVLIYFWIANGYIEPKENKSLEDIGNKYTNDLISASFFQETASEDFPNDNIKMHDLMYDLAVMVSKGEIVKIDENTKSGDINPLKIRHLAIFNGQRCPNTINWDRLHSIAIIDGQWKIPKKIFSQLRSIRVLTGVSGEDIQCLTKNLTHLRFLILDDIDIVAVSMEPLNCLHNLQLLLISIQSPLIRQSPVIAQSLSKLTNLRVLYLYNFLEPIGVVEGVGSLTSLRYLQAHAIQDRDGCRIGELKKLSELHGKLTIYNLKNVQDGEATEAMLHEKTYLKELMLVWDKTFYGETSAASHYNNHESVLEGLQPHPNLKKLSLDSFGGSFCRPHWMGEQLTGMVEIELSKCNNMVELPPLGQLPRLKKLVFRKLDRLQRVTAQFYGNVSSSSGIVFPSLESLKFLYMRKWQEWQGVHGKNLKWFPCLQELVISYCRELRELPHLPSSIRKLKIDGAQIQKLPNFWGCNGKTQHSQEIPSFLTFLYIHACNKMESLGEACVLQHPWAAESLEQVCIQRCRNIKTMDLTKIKSIEELYLFNCRLLSEISIGCPCNLAKIRISECPNLMHITFGSMNLKMSNQSASTSYISQYPLPEVDILHTDCRHLLKACDPTKLKELDVDVSFYVSESTCFTYEEMKWWQSLTSLEKLILSGADDFLLSSWVSNFFPNAVSLEGLLLYRCYRARSLPEKELPTSLQYLEIGDECPHLVERYKDGGPGQKVLLDLIPGLRIY